MWIGSFPIDKASNRDRRLLNPLLFLLLVSICAVGQTAQDEGYGTRAESGVDPSPTKPDVGAPNVVLIMTDDVGFGASSVFGGAIPKTTLERIARHGFVFNRFHTSGVCAPTRAALLTGRNPHQVGFGSLPEMATEYPGYTGIIPDSAATLSRVLRDNGYSTAMFGKEHNVLPEHRSVNGPFSQWPTGRGFDYFYGFVAADTDQFHPALHLGTEPLIPSERDDDYILDRDLIDRTITWIHNQKAANPDKPFFIYQSFGTAHAPQQAPVKWIEKFRGKFDHGWDEERRLTLERQKQLGTVPESTQLARRPDSIPPWVDLSDKEKKVYARFMEVYAAMLSHQDYQLGRLVDELDRMGILNNTLIIYIEGDNGSAGDVGNAGSLNELASITGDTSDRDYDLNWLADNLHTIGGPDAYAAIPAGWAFAMSTPFPWVKQVASHLGAVRNGLVISWPEKIVGDGSLRSQYHHVIDIMPTILDAAGIEAPITVDGVAQQPLDGVSMLYALTSLPDGPSRRITQYYEVLGNRALYHKGWLANTTPRNLPWNLSRWGAGTDTSTYEWELYNLERDFSQSMDLAGRYPDRLRELREMFAAEAQRNQVNPVQDSGARYRASIKLMGNQSPRGEYLYWGGGIRVPMELSPPIFQVPFALRADIEITGETGEGVIYAAGSRFGGWSFYLHEGRPAVTIASSPTPGGSTRIIADRPVPPGRHFLEYQVRFQGETALIQILLDETHWGDGSSSHRPPVIAGGGETFDTGWDTNVPVSSDYGESGVFSGIIHKLLIELRPGMQEPRE